jgi:hypothetical protein
MEPPKSTYENIKNMASHGLENLSEAASNLINKFADKVSVVNATNVGTEYLETKT